VFATLKRYWRNLAGGDAVKSEQEPKPEHRFKAEFRLTHGPLLIGILTFEKGLWAFSYSEEFKKRKDLRPIVQFPDKEKEYHSDELWPFFGMRIPSLKQPSVGKIVEAERIDTNDRVELLKRFGRRTVSNPYELAGSD
jgi:HipA-like protein